MDNSINCINFKGAFLVKQPSQELKNNLLRLLDNKRGKQIIENMSDKGDILYVVRDKFDKGMSDILSETKYVTFKYYPSLNTKSGFDDQKPQEAKSILRTAANKVISTKQGLEAFFRPRPKMPFDIIKIQENNLKLVQEKLFVDVDNKDYIKHIDPQTGVCTIKTKIKNNTSNINNSKKFKDNPKKRTKDSMHTLITITPPGMFGICYIKYVPVHIQYPTRRLAVQNGEIIFEYGPGSKAFIKNFSDAEENYKKLFEKFKQDMAEYNKRQ